MKISSNNSTSNGQAGFSLIEIVFAMVILLVGVLAVLTLIVEGIKVQKASRESTEALSFGRAKMEEVGARPRMLRLVGGNLDGNASNYHENFAAGQFVARWQIEERDAGIPATADIPTGVQRVTVRVVTTRVGALWRPVTIKTLMP